MVKPSGGCVPFHITPGEIIIDSNDVNAPFSESITFESVDGFDSWQQFFALPSIRVRALNEPKREVMYCSNLL